MTETYTPKVGDRVRATHVVEGVVTGSEDGHWSYIEVEAEDGRIELHDEDRWTFEKLQDPEPQWVNGDVVKASIFIPAYRLGGEWRTVDGDTHYFSRGGGRNLTDAWKDGKVEYLYKADSDAEKVA